MYLCYREESAENRKKLIEQTATERNMSVKDVLEGIMPYVMAERLENGLGRSVYIVGDLEQAETYKAAQKRFKALKKHTHSMYDVKPFKFEDASAVALAKLRLCDTVYFLNGWSNEPIARKVRKEAQQQRKIIRYQEHEV